MYLLAGPTDMRRGFDGLFALAKELLEADQLRGHLFGFCNKGRTRLKLLYWDGSGLWVCANSHDALISQLNKVCQDPDLLPGGALARACRYTLRLLRRLQLSVSSCHPWPFIFPSRVTS